MMFKHAQWLSILEYKTCTAHAQCCKYTYNKNLSWKTILSSFPLGFTQGVWPPKTGFIVHVLEKIFFLAFPEPTDEKLIHHKLELWGYTTPRKNSYELHQIATLITCLSLL